MKRKVFQELLLAKAERFIPTNNAREDAFLPFIFRNVVICTIPVHKSQASMGKTEVAFQFC